MNKILLIEDNKDVRENTAEILELAGYYVATAANGKLGIEEVNKNKPDLIICDIMMPNLDGYGVLHLLAKNPETTNIPFIFLTAKTERSEVRKGMEMGADDYITKPFDKIELLNAIESRFKKNESLKKEYQKNIHGLNEFIANVNGEEALKKFIEGRKVIFYKKKENIYKEGNYQKGLYYIAKGKVKAFKMSEYGKELITALFGEEDFFGYSLLLEENDSTENTQALEDSEIVFIPKDEFFNLVYNHREIAKKFLYLLSKNVVDQQEKLLELAYSSVRKRVAEALLNLREKYQTTNNGNFSMLISRENLAGLAGIATETTIRTLSDFKDEGLIEIKGSVITLLNQNKLAAMRN
jgi:DNA-binding response OmpR family regulator